MSCTIKSSKALIYYCANDKLRMLKKRAGAQTHKNGLTEIGFKARIDASKGAQARIDASKGAQARINDN